MSLEASITELNKNILVLIKQMGGAKVSVVDEDAEDADEDAKPKKGRGRPAGAKNKKGTKASKPADDEDEEEAEEEAEDEFGDGADDDEDGEEDEATSEMFLDALRKVRDFGGKNEQIEIAKDILKNGLKVKLATDVKDGAQAAKGIALATKALAKLKKGK